LTKGFDLVVLDVYKSNIKHQTSNIKFIGSVYRWRILALLPLNNHEIRMYMRYLLIALLPLAALSSCKNAGGDQATEEKPQLQTVEVTDSSGYVVKYTRRAFDYAKEGEFSRRSPDGKLLEVANFAGDTLHGLRILFYETGDTQIVETYQNGNFEGPYKAYYPNGQLELIGQYVGNTMDGEWKRYYDTGELMEVVTLRDNLENGPFKEYYKNGNLRTEGTYKDGDYENGLLKKYDESGTLIQTMNCEMGVCRTVWKKD